METKFLNDGLARIEDKTIARSWKGKLALVPRGSGIGDLVVISNDGRVVSVLRNASTGDGFQISGERYVHGVMNGKKA